MDPELEEIRKLQMERKKLDGKVISLNSVSYDEEFYSESRDKFETSIAVGDDDDVDFDEEDTHASTSKARFLNSFSAPKEIMRETYDAKEAELDPFKDHKKKTIADKENEYRARWRKRARLSPPRLDPYAKNGGDRATHNSYRDVMLDATLEKERAEVVRKIEMKKREEKDLNAREERRAEREKRENEKRKAKEEKRKRRGKSEEDERSPKDDKSSSPKLSAWEREDDEEQEERWRLDVIKNGAKMESLFLEPDITYTLGRGDAEIKLEHQSCSKNHAKIAFINNRPNLMDLNSTNNTFLNTEEVTPGQWYKLSDGDVLKFGCSTRDYHVKCG